MSSFPARRADGGVRAPNPARGPDAHIHRAGLAAGLGAYGLWGMFPLYFALVAAAGPLEIVAHRAVWSFVVCVLILVITRTWRSFAVLWRSPGLIARLATAAALLSLNWLVYVLAVTTGRTLDASLGYYLNPIVTVLLGVLLLGERLRRAQWVAVGLGGLAVLVMLSSGSSPWISLALALTFGLYGLAKKRVGATVGEVPGMAVETAVLLLPALGYLTWLTATGAHTFGGGDTGLPAGALEVFLILSGPVTTVPLLLFAAAARRLPLSTIGLIQFLTPTVQFLLAWLVFDEPLSPARWAGFGIVWVAVVILTLDIVRGARAARRVRRDGTAART